MGAHHKKKECLTPQMGRPKTGSLSTFSSKIIDKIDEYRPSNKGWGPDTIKVELDLDESLSSLKRPSVSSISKYLKSKSRVRTRNKHVPLVTQPAFATKRAHQIWQLDAEGNCTIENIGTISFLNIKGIHRKVYIQNYPCLLPGRFNHPTTIDYQNVLRLGMMEFGKPQGLQVDHESIYFDNVNASPFPTVFHLWLIGLHIEMHLTPKGKPYKQGAVEKSHQTMQIQVVEGQSFSNWLTLFQRSQIRRQRLNYHIPCRMIGRVPPLVACPEAKHSGRDYQPDLEKRQFDMNAIYEYLAQGKWYRKVSSNRTAWIGGTGYYLSIQVVPNIETKILFDKKTKCFIFYDSDENIIAKKKAKGLTFKELSGDLRGFIKSIKKNPHINYP